MHTELAKRTMRRGPNNRSDIPMTARATPTRPIMSGISGETSSGSGGRLAPGISTLTLRLSDRFKFSPFTDRQSDQPPIAAQPECRDKQPFAGDNQAESRGRFVQHRENREQMLPPGGMRTPQCPATAWPHRDTYPHTIGAARALRQTSRMPTRHPGSPGSASRA